jgi:hypothetical protein
MASSSLSEQDWQVRLFVYSFFVENERPPTYLEAAENFKLSAEEARETYHRLHDFHTLFLEPGTDSIRIANPLSAIPTNYLVHIKGKKLWANCAWDSLGIPAMLNTDGEIVATNPLSHEAVTYSIQAGELISDNGLVHFPLPFTRWYDDLIET